MKSLRRRTKSRKVNYLRKTSKTKKKVKSLRSGSNKKNGIKISNRLNDIEKNNNKKLDILNKK